MKKVYVLFWWYSDGSGEPEVLRVYQDKDDAELDKAMIEKSGSYNRITVVEADFRGLA